MNLENFLPGRGETVLVVDDETVTRMMVRQVLEASQYSVLEAEDGAEALAMARHKMPELVLMDVRMPRMNGFDACKALRELPAGRHVPILMLTGLDDVVAVQLAFDSGATDFITKPINWALLAQRLRYALRAKEQEERLRESEARLAHAQHLARLGHWRLDLGDGSLAVSSEFARHLDIAGAADALPLSELSRRIHQRDRFVVYRHLRRVLRSGEPADLEFRLLNPQGGLCTLHLHAERGEAEGRWCLHGTVQDVSGRIEAEARISYFSHYDTLTDLPNRVLFWDRLTHTIAESRRSGRQFAVFLVDLDRFAALNASIGHVNGDRVLRILTQRLKQNLRDSDTLSRIGGDEFAIIYQGMEKESDLTHILSRIVDCFDQAIREENLEVFVNASIGIGIYPNDGEDLDTLLMHADVAKGRAKDFSGSSYQFYTAAMGDIARERMTMEAALRRGVDENSYLVHYQPLVRLDNSEVWGVEVLVRWQHPTAGLVLPDVFIPILEENGLLPELGAWTLRRACEEMRESDLVISVNLSPVQFNQPDMVACVRGILDETGFPPERLQLEITENVLIDDHQRTKAILEALRRLRIKLAIDDFGTGFSSLAYLKHYKVDFLKIDRTFIGEMLEEKVNKVIVNSTINLGHDLGIGIISEGVEHPAVLDYLSQMSCDLAQGFLIAGPMNRASLNDWLTDRGSSTRRA